MSGLEDAMGCKSYFSFLSQKHKQSRFTRFQTWPHLFPVSSFNRAGLGRYLQLQLMKIRNFQSFLSKIAFGHVYSSKLHPKVVWVLVPLGN